MLDLHQRRSKVIQITFLLFAAMIFGILYWQGAVQQLELNKSPGVIDQDAYMEYAQRLYKTDYTYIGDRNRMPVYPFLQSLFYRKHLHRKIFFQEGKQRNLVLSIFLLSVIAILFKRHFSSLHTLNSVLIIAFTVFIFKAGWFQAELLFYFFNFLMFYLMWQLLKNPNLLLAMLAGIVAGLAQLTKASILPGLILFLVFASLQGGWFLYSQNRMAHRKSTTIVGKSHFLTVLLVGLFFLISVYPYIRTSKRVFGQYFYNVNSTFYLWYDSWEEAKEGTRAHGDREGWPDMPPEEIPSLSKYLREHTISQIFSRFVNGSRMVMYEVTHSYGYFPYITFYLSLLLVVSLLFWKNTIELARKNLFLLLFALSYFVVYFLLYFWYAYINEGNRLILAQFIPLLFVISCGLHAFIYKMNIRIKSKPMNLLTLVNLVVFVVLCIDIYYILTYRVGEMLGGK